MTFFFFIDDAFWSDYSCDSQTRVQNFILFFNASINFLLIDHLHVDHSHFMNQYFEDSRHRICWRSNIFHQRIIDNQSILDFLRTNYQFHVFIEKTFCRHYILFYLLDSLQTFNQFFDEEQSQIVLFALLSYLEDYCFFSLNFLQLSLLIDVIIRRYNRRRRRVDFALRARLRRDNVEDQSDDDFRSIALDVV